MRHPFWIVNSTLLMLVVCAVLFMYISRVSVPEKETIAPPLFSSITRDHKIDINISKIYENDLFGTYRKESPLTEEQSTQLPFPEPPEPQRIALPEPPQPQFLDPLPVTLKGIIVINNNSAKNSALIEDNKTKTEKAYRVNDMIEDAQLIRIWQNKVIFLRSNGQQEILYLREQDAKRDPAYAAIQDWEGVAQPLAPNMFAINPQEFTMRIQNLAQFIDMFNLTTAYQAGKSIGCRIGAIVNPLLGRELGIEPGDIILSVNNIAATTTPLRLQIYKSIVETEKSGTITVDILRRGNPVEIQYVLKEFSPENKAFDEKSKAKIERLQKEEKDRILKEKYQFAPTINDIRKKERRNMFDKGGLPIGS